MNTDQRRIEHKRMAQSSRIENRVWGGLVLFELAEARAHRAEVFESLHAGAWIIVDGLYCGELAPNRGTDFRSVGRKPSPSHQIRICRSGNDFSEVDPPALFAVRQVGPGHVIGQPGSRADV